MDKQYVEVQCFLQEETIERLEALSKHFDITHKERWDNIIRMSLHLMEQQVVVDQLAVIYENEQ